MECIPVLRNATCASEPGECSSDDLEARRWANLTFAEIEEYRSCLSTASFKSRWPVLGYLIALMIAGFFSNSAIMIVYFGQHKRQASRVFMLSIAFVDMTTTLVGLPLQILTIRYAYNTNSVLLCRSMFFFSTVPTQASGIILAFIAVDRLHRIWMPMAKHMTERQCIGLNVGIVVFSLVVFGYFTPVYGIHRKESHLQGIPIKMCWIDDNVEETVYLKFFRLVFNLLFSLELIVMIVSYVLIGVKVFSKNIRTRFKNNQYQDAEGMVINHTSSACMSADPGKNAPGDTILDRNAYPVTDGEVEVLTILPLSDAISITNVRPSGWPLLRDSIHKINALPLVDAEAEDTPPSIKNIKSSCVSTQLTTSPLSGAISITNVRLSGWPLLRDSIHKINALPLVDAEAEDTPPSIKNIESSCVSTQLTTSPLSGAISITNVRLSGWPLLRDSIHKINALPLVDAETKDTPPSNIDIESSCVSTQVAPTNGCDIESCDELGRAPSSPASLSVVSGSHDIQEKNLLCKNQAVNQITVPVDDGEQASTVDEPENKSQNYPVWDWLYYTRPVDKTTHTSTVPHRGRHSNANQKTIQRQHMNQQSISKHALHVRTHTTLVMAIITFFYILSWLPFNIMRSTRSDAVNWCREFVDCAHNVDYALSLRSVYVNSAINAYVFGFFNSVFRKEVDEYLSCLSTESFKNRWPVVGYLIAVLIAGIFSNSFVLAVYLVNRGHRHHAIRMFLLPMAFVDTTTILVGLPLQLITIRYAYNTYSYWLCRGVFLFVTLPTQASGMLLAAIALERLHRVWKPFVHRLSERQSVIVTISSIVLSFVLFGAYVPVYGIHARNSHVVGISVKMCWFDDYFLETFYVRSFKYVVGTVLCSELMIVMMSYLFIAIKLCSTGKRKHRIIIIVESPWSNGISSSPNPPSEEGYLSPSAALRMTRKRKMSEASMPMALTVPRPNELMPSSPVSSLNRETNEKNVAYLRPTISPGNSDNTVVPLPIVDDGMIQSQNASIVPGESNLENESCVESGYSTKFYQDTDLHELVSKTNTPKSVLFLGEPVASFATLVNSTELESLTDSFDSSIDSIDKTVQAEAPDYVTPEVHDVKERADIVCKISRRQYVSLPDLLRKYSASAVDSIFFKEESNPIRNLSMDLAKAKRRFVDSDYENKTQNFHSDQALHSLVSGPPDATLETDVTSMSGTGISLHLPTRKAPLHPRKYRMKTRAIFLMALLTILYVINWMPYGIVRTTSDVPINFCENFVDCGRNNIEAICFRSVFINSVTNAFVYSFLDPSFRDELFHILKTIRRHSSRIFEST